MSAEEEYDDMPGGEADGGRSDGASGQLADAVRDLQGASGQPSKPAGAKAKAGKTKKQKPPKKEKPVVGSKLRKKTLADRVDDLRRSPVPIVVLAILGGLAGFWLGRPELAAQIILGATGAIAGGGLGWVIHG